MSSDDISLSCVHHTLLSPRAGRSSVLLPACTQPLKHQSSAHDSLRDRRLLPTLDPMSSNSKPIHPADDWLRLRRTAAQQGHPSSKIFQRLQGGEGFLSYRRHSNLPIVGFNEVVRPPGLATFCPIHNWPEALPTHSLALILNHQVRDIRNSVDLIRISFMVVQGTTSVPQPEIAVVEPHPKVAK